MKNNGGEIMNINAEIIPYVSLGGIQLYSSIKDIMLYEHALKFEMYARHLIKYEIDSAIEIHINIINGKIYKLCAKNNYKGSFKGIIIGSNLTKLSCTLENLIYDDFEEIFILDGVIIETVLKKNEQTNKFEDIVTSLSIYVKELDCDIDKIESIENGQW